MPGHWLMKSEPDVYGILDLDRDRRTPWEGVRNYQARNFLRDRLRIGDLALFHHSNANPAGVAGLMRVATGPAPDPSAWDPASPYFDPRSTPERPVWFKVDLEHVETFPRVVSLAELRADPLLDGLMVTRRGMRLSIQPLAPAHFRRILALARG